jgi:hypothetical protein
MTARVASKLSGQHAFTNKIALKKKGKRSVAVTDTVNGALAASVGITVT